MRRHIRGNKGFTLIELMIVVVIIGILAAIAIPKFSNVGNEAKKKEADGVLKQVATLQEAYMVRFGQYTTAFTGNENATPPGLEAVGWSAPALKHWTVPTVTVTQPDATTGLGGAFRVTMAPHANEKSLVPRCLIFTAGTAGTAATQTIGETGC
jgi:prepilin-type N-terminal cleavage/methylation domain-containing protein